MRTQVWIAFAIFATAFVGCSNPKEPKSGIELMVVSALTQGKSPYDIDLDMYSDFPRNKKLSVIYENIPTVDEVKLINRKINGEPVIWSPIESEVGEFFLVKAWTLWGDLPDLNSFPAVDKDQLAHRVSDHKAFISAGHIFKASNFNDLYVVTFNHLLGCTSLFFSLDDANMPVKFQHEGLWYASVVSEEASHVAPVYSAKVLGRLLDWNDAEQNAPEATPVTHAAAPKPAPRIVKMTPIDGQELKRFSVVIGSYADKTNATRMKERMLSQGYKALIAKDEKNTYRVIIATFDNKLSATVERDAFKAKFHDNPDLQKAWILETPD
ncbi:MAG: SPOR domain-containing protein [Dysgonamonadaceae bacterium]|nr:SPOR domain-containing protein [Dysgonamonadaceae bacterium]